MRSKRSKLCQVCTLKDSKYTCSSCQMSYCSVACYKTHKESCQVKRVDLNVSPKSIPNAEPIGNEAAKTTLDDVQLRPLTSLKWPHVPEESAYPDPLKRDDPKPLQLNHYEAIATSPAVRRVLAAHPHLAETLKALDSLKGRAREEAFERALGLSPANLSAGTNSRQLSDEVVAFRQFAESIEAAVRGHNPNALGLDWGD